MASANVPALTSARHRLHPVDRRRRRVVHVRQRRGHGDVPRPLGVAAPDRRRLRHRGRPVAAGDRAARPAHRRRARRLSGPALLAHARDAREQQRRLDRAVARRGRARQLQHLWRQDDGRDARDVRRDVAELRHGQPDDDGLRRAEPGRVRRQPAAAATWGSRRCRPRTTCTTTGACRGRQHRADADDRRQRRRRASSSRCRTPTRSRRSRSRTGSPACTTGRTTATSTARPARRRRPATRSAASAPHGFLHRFAAAW